MCNDQVTLPPLELLGWLLGKSLSKLLVLWRCALTWPQFVLIRGGFTRMQRICIDCIQLLLDVDVVVVLACALDRLRLY